VKTKDKQLIQAQRELAQFKQTVICRNCQAMVKQKSEVKE